jgi:hypothetical protein
MTLCPSEVTSALADVDWSAKQKDDHDEDFDSEAGLAAGADVGVAQQQHMGR